MGNVLNEIIGGLTAGISEMASGLGEGLTTLVSQLFATSTANDVIRLTAFGQVIVIFAGVSLAVGLSRWALGFFTSLGARNS